jgi:E3 ubiquitin-protein ligase CCNP1IP1
MPQHRVSPRQPLANLNGNSPGPGFAGYGMSAGLKVSNPAGSGANGFSRPVVRSRGIHNAWLILTAH